MRPAPNEVAEGIRRILAEVVAPAVDDEYASARLDEVRAVLAQIDWDNAGLSLLREQDALVELVARVQERLDVQGPNVPTTTPTDFPSLAQARAILDAWIVDRLDALPDELRGQVEAFYLG